MSKSSELEEFHANKVLRKIWYWNCERAKRVPKLGQKKFLWNKICTISITNDLHLSLDQTYPLDKMMLAIGHPFSAYLQWIVSSFV